MTLTEFLLARIAEDEAVAHVCAESFPAPWDVNDRGHSATVRADEPNFWIASEIDQDQETPGRWPGEHLEHIARHDPARVLAECEAKRRIVTTTADTLEWIGSTPILSSPGARLEDVARLTLKTLAAVYADHPDYREEWRP